MRAKIKILCVGGGGDASTKEETLKNYTQYIDMFELPEGGKCNENYRASMKIATPRGERMVCTSIYYLMQQGEQSCWHRLTSDELWLFHDGAPFELFSIADGKVQRQILGLDMARGELPQILFEAGTWFGARMNGAFGLCGCVVAPGFDERDIEFATPEQLAGVGDTFGVLQDLTK